MSVTRATLTRWIGASVTTRHLTLATILGLLIGVAVLQAAEGPIAQGTRGVIATVHPLATRAGMQAYSAGGNALDAAIAAALTLGVVDSHNSGLGGGCFILLRRPDGNLSLWDGRETAPATATATMFIKDGVADPQLSQTGPLAVATPGALAAYDAALHDGGRLALAQLLRPAAQLARQGFTIDRVMARNLRETREELLQFPETSRILLRPDTSPRAAGELLTQLELANTYQAIADHGIDWFYRGDHATRVDAWMRDHGGLLRASDFAAYRVKTRTPILTTYRGYSIVGFPPPSSGGVHVAQILNIVEHFDLAALQAQDPALVVHVVAEAMKLAFADRAHWLGDSDFVDVPRGLYDKAYARELAKQIDLQTARPVAEHHLPPNWQHDLFPKHTTHITAADAEGNWVGITATINTSFGSKIIVPGTGLLLNNEMDDFAAQPGVPNAFGLVGAANNAVAPGKRPLSSMSPTLVLRDGQPIFAVGAAGGPRIITQVVLAIIRKLDLRQSLEVSIGGPRWHHQWRPDRLLVESTLPLGIVESLRQRGHDIEPSGPSGVAQAIEQLPDGTLQAIHDPRVPGLAAGY